MILLNPLSATASVLLIYGDDLTFHTFIYQWSVSVLACSFPYVGVSLRRESTEIDQRRIFFFFFQLIFSSPTGCRMFQNFLFFVMSFIRFAWKKTGRMKCHLVVSLYRPSHWCVPISSGKEGQKWLTIFPIHCEVSGGIFSYFGNCVYPPNVPSFRPNSSFSKKKGKKQIPPNTPPALIFLRF